MKVLAKREIGLFDHSVERRGNALVIVIRNIQNGYETILSCTPEIIDSLKKLVEVAETNMDK